MDRRKLLESAQRFLKKGQIRKAISDYEKLVADDPRNIRIRSKLADLYVRNDNIDRAVEEYVRLAKQYEAEDFNSRAISMYKRVLTIRPKRIDVHYWLADLYKKEGLFGNAKVLYQNIIRLNPEDQAARTTITELDQTIVRVNPVHRADEALSVSGSNAHDRISPDDQPVLEASLIVDETLDLDEFPSGKISSDEEIIELEDPLDHLSGADKSAGDTSEYAEKHPYFTHQKVDLDQEVSPEKDLESHYHLGIAYMEMGFVDKAIAEFEAALDYGPKKIDCLVMLGHCYMEKGISDRSISCLERALRSEGLTRDESIHINKQLAKVYEACGMKEKAWQAFRRAGLTGNNPGSSNQ